jgi:hypothetical protein
VAQRARCLRSVLRCGFGLWTRPGGYVHSGPGVNPARARSEPQVDQSGLAVNATRVYGSARGMDFVYHLAGVQITMLGARLR